MKFLLHPQNINSMYFTLIVNERLADAIRIAVELKAQIGKIVKDEASKNQQEISAEKLTGLDETVCGIITELGSIAGSLLSKNAVCESEKEIANYQSILDDNNRD